jgi:transcriptional regulator of acetoin/glycerol metabolism
LAREQTVTAADLNLPALARAPVREGDNLTREMVEATLREAGGNVSRAAHSLGLSRQALYRRMERFNLKPGA